MDIQSQIHRLLVKHDCVIIPEIGGFITNYHSAEVQHKERSNYVFMPPSKDIVFNSSLKNNDGLLIQYIVENKPTSYPKAEKIVHRFVKDISKQLQEGKPVTIKKTGVLFLDREGNIQFNPDNSMNFLVNSFGLAPFEFNALENETEKYVAKKTKQPQRKTSGNAKRWRTIRTIAIALPVALALTVVPLSFETVRDTLGFSNPDVHQNQLEQYDSQQANLFNHHITKNNAISKANQEQEIIDDEQKPAECYYIIAGSFSSVENAKTLENQLKAQNYKAVILSNDKKHRVAYGRYENRNIAERELNKIRNTKEKSTVWLYAAKK